MIADQAWRCPVCGGPCSLLDAVDFNKSCEEAHGKFLGSADIPVVYALCGACGFCFAPQFAAWDLDRFAQRIYNDDYVLVDPDYADARPRQNAATLISMFGERAQAIRHIDYGGGSGLLAQLLREKNWQSVSYDPFTDRAVHVAQLGKFDLITAFEVFEHVPDVRSLMSDLRSLLSPGGVVLFSTLLSDGKIHPGRKLDWWYAAPRNGHISLFSRQSLAILAQQNDLNIGSFSAGFHILFSKLPPWAAQSIHMG